MSTATTTIRLPPEDIAMAKKLAEDKGIGYQTYLKMLIKKELRKAKKKEKKA